MTGFWCSALSLIVFGAASLAAEPLPNTQPLTVDGDLAAQMVAGIDKYLMRELAASAEKRQHYWKPDVSSMEAYAKSVQPNRERLARILGVVDKRLPVTDLEYVATTGTDSLVAEGDGYRVYAVRWPVLEGVDAEGLLLEPKDKPLACVVALPEADWTPEMLVGLAPGVPKESQFARRLAEYRCRVLVPTLINRQDTYSGNPQLGRWTNQPHREFIYRMAYEMGRHIIGYEVQKVLAAVDWFTREKGNLPVGVYGYGEGGLLALYGAALDERIKATVVSGCFTYRENLWQEPIFRNIWGLLREFGDGEVAGLVAPRALYIERSEGPAWNGPPAPRSGRSGAAPGRLVSPGTGSLDRLREGEPEMRTFDRAFNIYHALKLLKEPEWKFLPVVTTADQPGGANTLRGFTAQLTRGKAEALPPTDKPVSFTDGPLPTKLRKAFDPAPRQKRQFDQFVAFTQQMMRDSERYRQQHFWAKLDTSSQENYQRSCEQFRKQFWEEIIGKLPAPTRLINPRSRLAYDEPKWKGYEVTLDLYPDVFAYGILLVPKDLKPGERRPVVVCQHGLEGRPQNVVNPKEKSKYYNSFGAQLADRGFIVYAPQNPYIGQDKFRVLQRKANPLGLSLFSFIVRQHERTLDWLAGLPFVDAERMAFYGLSYGGKTAMRVPAILPRYCLSICSGDFNEWIWKNVSVDFPASYIFSGEYEMFEFNLGHTFNYAEMAALIAPRPFMVERGHNDGVGIDEWVAYEYAKVRRLYAKLGIPDRTAIEFFNSGHEINGKGTFAFLETHLHWPK
jgi:dienelactone hydrolase